MLLSSIISGSPARIVRLNAGLACYPESGLKPSATFRAWPRRNTVVEETVADYAVAEGFSPLSASHAPSPSILNHSIKIPRRS